ncbi:MAG: APC family permease [Bryobacteraceae bacterium]|nr:APC family permease [Bryobacteraceae bacterium]
MSGGLRRELGLRDVILFSMACVIGTRWLGAAAHSGAETVPLWIGAAALFLVPYALAIGTLSERDPRAGGFYHWIKADFGEWPAFLCFWLYWTGIACWFPNAAMSYMSTILYTLGGDSRAMANSQGVVVGLSLAVIWLALLTNVVGMKVGKWTENLGAMAVYALWAVLVMAAYVAWRSRGVAAPLDFRVTPDLGTIALWSQIAFALSGLELTSLMGGEIKDPKRTIPIAGGVAAGAAALFYAAGTLAMLVLLRPADVNEINGVGQAAAEAGTIFGAPWMPPAIALMVLMNAAGQFGGLASGTARLPFAVGADKRLPAAFARIHPRWGTPHVSMLFFGTVCSFFLLAMQLGDTMRTAYQELVSMMVLTTFVPTGAIFLCAWKAGRRWSAACGAGVTALAMLLSLAPPEGASPLVYEAKILGGTGIIVLTGRLLYRRSSAPR